MGKSKGKKIIFKKALSLLLSLSMILGMMTTVFADNEEPAFSKVTDSDSIVISEETGKFKDITSETHPWAVEAVEAMTEKGIINGTSDTTFSPDNNVTKVQALLLISRMLGYNDDAIQSYINTIYDLYANELNSLSTAYKKEMAYLVFNGAFSLEEIKAMDFEDSLTREEVALFLSKADKADLENYLVKSGKLYSDNDKISSGYDKSVYYVSEKGYMNGLGDNMFGPLSTVTRAQMATMLYRIIEKTDLSFHQAVVDKVKPNENKLTLFADGKTVELGSDVVYRNKGKKVEAKEYYSNLYCIATYVDGVVTQLDAFFAPLVVEEVVDGKITYLPSTKTGVQITNVDTDDAVTYKWADRYTITIRGEDAEISQLRKYDYAVLSLNAANEIIALEVLETDATLKDLIITDIEIGAQTAHIVLEDKDENEYKYEIRANADIRKNGSVVEFSSLGKGDRVSKLILSYNRIKSIDAHSEITSTRGTISTIHISALESYIVLSNGTDESKFDLNKNTLYYVYGEPKSLYDLELDQYASITLDGTVVSKVEVAAASATATNIMGTVVAVNPAASILSVQTADGVVVVYISKKATSATKIIDNDASASTTRTLSDIKEGATITAIGVSEAGYFTASTIVYSNK